MTGTTTLGLEERIARIEAREEIIALKYRYFRACDAKDAEGFRAAFISKGAAIDYGPLGKFDDADDITDIYKAIALEKENGRYVVLDMHHGLQPDIVITGEGTAEGQWTLQFRQANLRDRTIKVSAMEYSDSYVVEDGEWKMSACKSTELWSIQHSLDAADIITDNLG